jgi:hypothetical protein
MPHQTNTQHPTSEQKQQQRRSNQHMPPQQHHQHPQRPKHMSRNQQQQQQQQQRNIRQYQQPKQPQPRQQRLRQREGSNERSPRTTVAPGPRTIPLITRHRLPNEPSPIPHRRLRNNRQPLDTGPRLGQHAPASLEHSKSPTGEPPSSRATAPHPRSHMGQYA